MLEHNSSQLNVWISVTLPLTLIMVNAEVKEKLQALFISSRRYYPKWYFIVLTKTKVKAFLVSLSNTS